LKGSLPCGHRPPTETIMSTSSADPERRDLPDFAEFMNLVRAQDPDNPVMVDADLLEEVFGDGTTS
jgi:hypothetical protein